MPISFQLAIPSQFLAIYLGEVSSYGHFLFAYGFADQGIRVL